MKKLLLLLLILTSCTKEELEPIEAPTRSVMVFPLSDHLSGEYYIYRTQVEGVVTYYGGSNTLLDILGSMGSLSPNIFDFDGETTVDTPDLLNILSGYGTVYTPDWSLDDITVDGTFSSGWIVTIPGWEIAFLKVTPYDEPCSCFVPDTLVSFFLEGVKDGQTIKVWYH